MANFKLFSQRDLDYMRAVQDANMPDQCTIQRPTRASDGRGGWTTTWTNVVVNVKCRLWISSGASGTSVESRHYGEHEMNVTEAFFIMPWDTDVQSDDQITWTSLADNTQRTFQVTGTNKKDSIITATRARVSGVRT